MDKTLAVSDITEFADVNEQVPLVDTAGPGSALLFPFFSQSDDRPPARLTSSSCDPGVPQQGSMPLPKGYLGSLQGFL